MDGATQVVSKLRAELQQLTIDHERLKARSAAPIIAQLPSASRPHLRRDSAAPAAAAGEAHRCE